MSLEANPLVRDWLRVDGDRLVVRTGKVDIGQRITTALVRIAAEELSVPVAQIDVDEVRTGLSPNEGVTSGSNSIEQSGRALRLACATARAAVFEAAAHFFGVDAGALKLEDGLITHPGANSGYRLLDKVAKLDPAMQVDPNARILPASRVQPVAMTPRHLEDMVRGAFRFLHDIERPGMLHARVVRPPHAAARLKSISPEARNLAANQTLRIVRDGSFLAVAGADEWDVIKSSQTFARGCVWDLGEGMPEAGVFSLLRRNPSIRLPVVEGSPREGESPPAISDPEFSAEFERPYQLHGALAPSAALAEWRDGLLTIHTHSQGIYPLRAAIADSLRLDEDAVELIHAPGSGCYGHNSADDAAFEAALIARSVPETPILLKWTREEEHRWEPVAPAMRVSTSATLDTAGEVEAWSAEVFSDTHRGRPRPGPDRAGPSRLLANRLRATPIEPAPAAPNMAAHGGMHRNLDPIYDFGSTRLVKNLVSDLPLRTSAMRCLGAVANIFALESMMDEMVGRNGVGAVDFRRRHLRDERAVAVLDRLVECAGPQPDADGAGRGIAYAQYKNAMTRVGVCVDLVVNEAAEVKLDRVVIVADAGRIVDPDGLTAQLEGGFAQGASWALFEEVNWDRSGVLSADWESYPVIRFSDIPEIETVLIDRPQERSVGAGEASPGPSVAAIANAVKAATGLRLTRMPFTPDALRAAALRT